MEQLHFEVVDQTAPWLEHGLPFSHAAECATLLRTFLDSKGEP
jgi:hypothetical protein